MLRPPLDTTFPILFQGPPQQVVEDAGDEAEDEEDDRDGDYGDTNTEEQEDWTEDLKGTSGLNTSPDQGLLPPPAPPALLWRSPPPLPWW